MPPKNQENSSEGQLQPFLRLGKYLPEDFIKVAEELLFLVREYGIKKSPPPHTTKRKYLDFVAHVHDGWKQAQRLIAVHLKDALNRRDKAHGNIKEQHRLRDKEGQRIARLEAHQIDVEITVLRRMLDVILWTVFSCEHSTLRRLVVVGGKHNLSIKNIEDAMPTADDINENPHAIALCTDMLSLVHIGDVLVVNRRDGNVSFVELKAGKKNYDISKAAEFAILSGCGFFENFATAEFDQTDMKHFERAKRQMKRNQTIVDTIKNEGGTDHNTGAKVHINTTDDAPQMWCETIMKCYEQLNETKKWAIATVDECVHIGVYSDQTIAFVGFKLWMQTVKCESPIYNLTDSFLNPSVRPLGAMFLSLELQKKILRGDIMVIICIDILKIIEMANNMHSGFLELASKRETSQMRDYRMGSLEYKGRFVRSKIGPEQSYIGIGFRDRVVYDQQRPSQLLKLHLAQMLGLKGAIQTEEKGAASE